MVATGSRLLRATCYLEPTTGNPVIIGRRTLHQAPRGQTVGIVGSEILVQKFLIFARSKTRKGPARALLEHRTRYLVVDCLNTKSTTSMKLVLHGLERFGGARLVIFDLAYDPQRLPGAV